MAIQDYLADIDSYTGGAKAEMDSANQAYADTAGAGSTLAGKLKEALNTKLNNNADLIEQKNSAMADYFAAPANARAQYQDIWNPFEREKLVANARTQAYKPYATFSDLLTNRMGQVSDIVGEGVQGWQYVIQQAQALAAAAAQKYQNLVGEYMNAAGLQNQADEMAWAKEQYNTDMAWDKEKFNREMASKGGSGSGSVSLSNMSSEDQNIVKAYVDMLMRGEEPDIPSKYQNAVAVAYNTQLGKLSVAQQKLAQPEQINAKNYVSRTPTNWLGAISDYFSNNPIGSVNRIGSSIFGK